MRLPLIAPETLKGEQRALYDDMKKGIEGETRESLPPLPRATISCANLRSSAISYA
jgi:hypothetical protein